MLIYAHNKEKMRQINPNIFINFINKSGILSQLSTLSTLLSTAKWFKTRILSVFSTMFEYGTCVKAVVCVFVLLRIFDLSTDIYCFTVHIESCCF